MSFSKSFFSSLVLHFLLVVFFLWVFAVAPLKNWGGGQTRLIPMIILEPVGESLKNPAHPHAILDIKKLKQTQTSPIQNFSVTKGKGDSKTPSGGEGLGTDQSSEKGKEDLLRQIHRQILYQRRYPKLALENELKGDVLLSFSIDSRGHPTQIQVERSSGISVLDEEAIHTVERAAPFPIVTGLIRFVLKFDLEE